MHVASKHKTPAPSLKVLFLTVALDLVGFGMVVPLLPLYARNLGASGQQISWLLAAYSLMQFFCAPLWGRLSDRMGRRPVLLGSILGHAAALFGFAAASSYGGLLLARLFAGAFTANVSVASAYIADTTSPQSRARGMGVLGAAFGLGFVAGPFFAAELSVWGARVPATVAALLALGNALLAYRYLPESLAPSLRARARLQPRQSWWRERLAVLTVAPGAWPYLVVTGLQVGGFAMMEMALSLYVARRFGFATQSSGRLLAYVGCVMVGVQGGLMGPLTRRFGEAWLLRTGLLLLGLTLWALAGLGNVDLAAGATLAALLLVLAGTAVGQGLVGPTVLAGLSRSVPQEAQGAALGLSQSISALGRTLGPALAGALLDARGEAAPLWAAGWLVLAAAAFAFGQLPRRAAPPWSGGLLQRG